MLKNKIKIYLLILIASLFVSCGGLIDPEKKLPYRGYKEYYYMRAQIDVLGSGLRYDEVFKVDKMDYGYTEGIGDAKEGDIRIKRWGVADDWAWKISPWDGGTHPIFDKLSGYETYMREN